MIVNVGRLWQANDDLHTQPLTDVIQDTFLRIGVVQSGAIERYGAGQGTLCHD